MEPPDPGWSSYVRGVLGPEIARGMERHLSRGCGRCKRRVRVLQALREVAENDRRFELPAGAVSSAKRLPRSREMTRPAETRRPGLALGLDSSR